jgi:hypothetical protein
MKRSRWLSRVLRSMLFLVPGTALLGSSCAADLRDSVAAAGMDFVEDATLQFLKSVFPVQDILNPQAQS